MRLSCVYSKSSFWRFIRAHLNFFLRQIFDWRIRWRNHELWYLSFSLSLFFVSFLCQLNFRFSLDWQCGLYGRLDRMSPRRTRLSGSVWKLERVWAFSESLPTLPWRMILRESESSKSIRHRNMLGWSEIRGKRRVATNVRASCSVRNAVNCNSRRIQAVEQCWRLGNTSNDFFLEKLTRKGFGQVVLVSVEIFLITQKTPKLTSYNLPNFSWFLNHSWRYKTTENQHSESQRESPETSRSTKRF